MATLDNSNRRLMEGVVVLLRENVDGWSENSEYNIDNVWSKSPPEFVDGEYPRGIVDITAGNDFELSHDLSVRLREVFLKVTVYSEDAIEAEDLIEDSESVIRTEYDSVAQNPSSEWEVDSYLGDWEVREVDGFTELVEDDSIEGKLRYNRSVDIIMETVKQDN